MNPNPFIYPHALIGTEVYTVLQGDTTEFPHLPPPPPLSLPESTTLPNLTLGWVPNDFPYLFLIPSHQPFYGPLFSRLNFESYYVEAVPAEPGNKPGYTLEKPLKTALVSLENNLRALLTAMVDIISVYLPKNFQLWAYPWRFGYRETYDNSRTARNAIYSARDAFIPLMAAITLMLLILDDRETPGNHDWRHRVLRVTGIHHEWLSALEDSVVGDLSVPRIGGIINMGGCQYSSLIRLLCRAKMNIYLHWGKMADGPVGHNAFLQSKGCIPSPAIVERLNKIAVASVRSTPQLCPATAASLNRCPNSAIDTAATAPLAPTPSNYHPTPPTTFPKVETLCGQKEGETMQAFFDRRKRENASKRETPDEKRSRLQREKHALRDLVPGKSGATAFYWKDDTGFRIREAAGRPQYEWLWETYGRNQRRYDGFSNQWDICTEFGDPDSDSDYGSDLEDIRYQDNHAHIDDAPPQPSPVLVHTDNVPAVPAEPLDTETQYSSVADLKRIYGPSPLPNINRFRYVDLEDTAYYRFGFVSPLNSGDVAHPDVIPEWAFVRKLLGDGRWRDTDTSAPNPIETLQFIMQLFFGYLRVGAQIIDIPMEIYDIRQENSDIRLPPRFLVRKEIFNGHHFFLLRHRTCMNPENAPMEIGVTRASLVLQLVRCSLGPDLISICRYLLNRGAAFKTFFVGPQRLPRSNYPPRGAGLGFKPANFCPGASDYAAYVSSRDELLRSARGRAALLEGGVVARIAREVVGYDDVLYGCSENLYENGYCFWNGGASSLGRWDDSLTDDELDKICGVYAVATGQSDDSGPQITHLSWWPKPLIWATSGLNLGEWSDDCERWFQAHLRLCISGQAKLRTADGWRHGIRFSKDISRIIERNETLAAEAVDHIFLLD